MIDWKKVSPEDFELLCFQLLGKLGFQRRTWFKGPGDRGRDITAYSSIEEIPGKRKDLLWIIECKRKLSGALSVSDILNSFERAVNHSPNKYLIITTSYLTVDTKDWLNQRAEKSNINVEIIEYHELEELMIRFPTPIGDKIRTYHLGSELTSYHQALIHMDLMYHKILQTTHPTKDEIGELVYEYSKLRKQLNDIPTEMGKVCLSEYHKIEYFNNGLSKTSYNIELLNLNSSELKEDDFRFYGDLAVNDNKKLKLTFDGLSTEHQGYNLKIDTGFLKHVNFKLPNGIFAGMTHKYHFSYYWPYPSPLISPRYYSTYGRRYKHLVKVEIIVPRSNKFSNVIATITTNGQSKRLTNIDVISNNLYLSYGPLLRKSSLNIYFQVV